MKYRKATALAVAFLFNYTVFHEQQKSAADFAKTICKSSIYML
jgi:hypothetical protein